MTQARNHSGREEILGREEIVGSVLDTAVKAVKKTAGLPLDVASWALKRTPVPSKSYFIGRDEILGEFVGDEARALAEDTRGERSAARRMSTPRAASCGYNSHWAHIRGDDVKLKPTDLFTPTDLATVQALAKKGNKKAKKLLRRLGELARTTSSGESPASKKEPRSAGQLQAREILRQAAASSGSPLGKSIGRADLKRAIWLYAGPQSTEQERTAIGSRMLQYLNKHQVKLAA